MFPFFVGAALGAPWVMSFAPMSLWWLGLTAVYVFFVHLSPFGNWIFAMGGDKVSARNAGIPTERLTMVLGDEITEAQHATFLAACQAREARQPVSARAR